MITPQQVGLPPKFQHWRMGQEAIITNMLNPEAKYHVAVVPTGGGKSASYMTVAMLNPGRTLILTSTKGLQDQLKDDFGDLVHVVKGQSAYKCKASDDVFFCNTGSCHWGYDCPFKKSGECRYWANIREAQQSKIVVTNYSFWMANQEDILGTFTLLVMDEAHDAAEHLLSALSMDIRREDTYGLGVPFPDRTCTQGECYQWAKLLRYRINDLVKKNKHGQRGRFRYLSLHQRLAILDLLWVENWVVEHKIDRVSFDAISPALLATGYLFRAIPKVIMTSAFVTKMDLVMLGIREEETDYKDYPSTFSIANRPIYFVPTVRVDTRITEAGMNAWATQIDNIIGSRFGWKGLIHTISYDRTTRICNFSRYKDFMIGSDKNDRNTANIVSQFKQADPPCILVSPSIVTGYDFPYEDARWQIIGKVPFPDSRPLVMKARTKVNADYGCYIALKQLVQATGRIVRMEDDWGESFIIDSHFAWMWGKYRSLLPRWWVESVKKVDTLPRPLGDKI